MFCKICGTENVPQASFCENCGAKLFEDSQPQNDATPAPVTAPEFDMSEPVEEEMYEYDEKPKKKKSTKVLIILIIVLAVLVCGAVGVLIAQYLSTEGVGFSDNSSSSGGTQQEEPIEDEEEDEEKKKEQTECENLVKDVMSAVKNENTGVVEEHLGFECGDSDDLAEKMAKTIADEFDCDYDELTDVCEKMLTEYFHGMESHIKDIEESGSEYIVTVSFTRLDKETVLDKILEFDADDYREELEEKYDDDTELTVEEIEKKIEEELVEKIVKVAEDAIADAELITDELEFVVAEDDGERFIYTDGSDFEALEEELTLED